MLVGMFMKLTPKPFQNLIYPTWLCQNSELEHDPVEIVDFPIDSMVIFQFAM